MNIILNNKEMQLPMAISVEELLLQENIPATGTAVAINGKVVRRDHWATHILNEGDNIILITAAYGG